MRRLDYVRGMFQKNAEKFNKSHNLYLIKLCFRYPKLEHVSNYFRKFEQNMLKSHDSMGWPLRGKFQFHPSLSFTLKLSSTFNLNEKIPIFGVNHQ